MGHTATSLNESRPVRPGDRLTARQLNAIQTAAKVATAMSFSPGQSAIIDKDGIHVRTKKDTTKKLMPLYFVGVVVECNPSSGTVQVQRAAGTNMSGLYPEDPTEVPITVWVGQETHLRGPLYTGGVYDSVICFENPLASARVTHPYIGYAMVPGFAHEYPTENFSAAQDNPPVITGTT